MKTIYRQFAKTYLSVSSSQARAIIGLILAAVLLLVGMRACSKYFMYERQEYRVIRGPIWFPGEMSSREKSMQGFEDDLIRAIAKKAEIQIQLYNGNGDLLSELHSRIYDGVLTTQITTPMQHNLYLFSNTIFFLGPKLVVGASSKVKELKDLNDKTIGILSGTALLFNIQNPSITFKTYDNMADALEDLDRQKIEGVIVDLWTAYAYTGGFYAGRLKTVPIALTQEGLRLATLNNLPSKEFIDLFNKNLEALRADGTFDTLLKKWNLY